jgi:hypothetical protein
MPSDILPANIIEVTTWYCRVCDLHLDDPLCPKCTSGMVKELPPLSVSVSDTSGVTGKIS